MPFLTLSIHKPMGSGIMHIHKVLSCVQKNLHLDLTRNQSWVSKREFGLLPRYHQVLLFNAERPLEKVALVM
jgi:hypothetical protein